VWAGTFLSTTATETKWPIQRMENLQNNKRVGMNGGEKKLGTNWDLVTCHYGVRLGNHASYRDWVDFPFLLRFSSAPDPLPLWLYTFISTFESSGFLAFICHFH
jgi:hypothetical protein